MKFENTRVFNFESALRGMRNPLQSWDKSDSVFGLINLDFCTEDSEVADKWIIASHPELNWDKEFSEEGLDLCDLYCEKLSDNGIINTNYSEGVAEIAFLGPNDLDLAQKLISAGPEHRKFLRQIFVSVDITAPIYWY